MAADSSPSVIKTKKRNLDKVGSDNPSNKKSKITGAKPIANKSGKPLMKQRKEGKPFKFKKSDSNKDNKEIVKDIPLTKREGRLRAKELAEIRKKKRKRHYTLEQELATLWEKMRQRNISEENRSELASEALKKMKGKISEIASSHVSSRVLQTCIKYCSIEERTAVFEELRPHFLTLACNPYAVHLVKKMLDNVPRKRLAEFISSLHGHVASLLRHMVGSVVVEHAYQMGNAKQKQELLMELYSTELQLFKDQATMKKSGLDEVISKLGLHKGSVSRHMIMVIQPILEKGIVDHSIVHRLLVEYLGIADKTSAMDILQQFSGPLLVRTIHTRDGSRIGVLCVKHGSAKERKKIIKGMKGHVVKIAHDQCGTMVLVSILSIVDDTKLVRKVIIRELQANLKELVLDKSGRRPFLQLLHPNSSRYLSPEDMASLNVSVPSLLAKDSSAEEANPKNKETGEKVTADIELTEDDAAGLDEADDHTSEGGKKDPSVRRQELLVDSGLAKSLVEVCTENAQELLTSAHAREVIFEVATGGAGGILLSSLGDEVKALHEAIASLVAKPKPKDVVEEGEEKEEHVLENFHSNRTIRKLVLDSPAFASTIWEKALKGDNYKIWAQGHSSKVLSAFLESSDSDVREMVKKELQPLVDSGVLKIPQTQKSKNED